MYGERSPRVSPPRKQGWSGGISLALASAANNNELGYPADADARENGMREQAHPQPANASAAAGDNPVNGTGREPFWDRDDVLQASPPEREIIDELRWAHENGGASRIRDVRNVPASLVPDAAMQNSGPIDSI